MPRVPSQRFILTVILLLCVLLGSVPPVGAQDPEPRDPKFTQVPPAPDRPPEVLVLEELGPEAVRTEVVIEAADDAYISSNFPAERLGRGTSLYLGYDATAPAFGAQRILLKFNLPTTLIPRDATINRARVRLYMARAIPPNDAPMRTHLRLLGSAWDEATVTWPGPTWASAPIPGITLDTAVGWKEWDVTDIVEDWVRTPSSNFGLELFGEEEAFEQEREFVASEAAGGNYPRLIVDFTADKAAPVTTVQALPATSSRTFTVSWGGTDPGGSGIAHYDVQYRVNEGEWVAWLNRVTFRSREFSGDRWNRYEFRVRATDRAGNVEAFGAGEARTVIPANQETLLPGSEADFNADGTADILWRDVDDGWVYAYLMNRGSIAGQGGINRVADRSWDIVGVADFNGDRRTDILWRDVDDGWNYLYLMNGTTIAGQGYINRVTDRNWQVAGVGDFNGDGTADILWRHRDSGWNYLYLMNGTTIIGQGYINRVSDRSWQIVGVADFNGDRRADILWRDTETGWNYLYVMVGTSIVGQGFISQVRGDNWKIIGADDFNGDRLADILWRDTNSGWNYLYVMNGNIIASQGYINQVADRRWLIDGVGDFNGDRLADILWRDMADGFNYVYFMNGSRIAAQGFINQVYDITWRVVGPLGEAGGNALVAAAEAVEALAAPAGPAPAPGANEPAGEAPAPPGEPEAGQPASAPGEGESGEPPATPGDVNPGEPPVAPGDGESGEPPAPPGDPNAAPPPAARNEQLYLPFVGNNR